MYGQQNKKLKIEIWSLFCMDLQKEQDWNVHDSGWMLVICKHLNWNWYWNWEYYISLTKGGDIVWVTESTKLRDLLITWLHDKCKALYLPFYNPYSHQNWQSGNLRWGNPTFQVTWPFHYVVTWQMKKLLSVLSQYLWSSNLVEW